MKTNKRKTGINLIEEVPWGAHLALLYKTTENLFRILVPYIKSGLENNEFCMWIVTSDFLTVNEAKRALERRVKDLDIYFKKGQIEILDSSQWYKGSEKLESTKILKAWIEKEKLAIQRGFDGIRITGDTRWIKKNSWEDFLDYEEMLNNIINEHKIIAICSYSIDMCGPSEIIDVLNSHRYVIVKKKGVWTVMENSQGRNIEELLISRDQLSRLFKYVESKRELEKRGTGKEIHDEIAQMLIGIKWRLNSLDKTLQTARNKSPKEIDMLSKYVDKLYRRTEKLFTELLPSVLNHFGFGAALEWLISDFKDRTGIKCEVNVIPEVIPLNWDHSNVLFRVTQALLTNVEEHANATELKIELSLKEDLIELKIIDNGIGITEEQVNDLKSYGLLEVKERIKFLGGEIDIKGFPDKETQIIISIKSDKYISLTTKEY